MFYDAVKTFAFSGEIVIKLSFSPFLHNFGIIEEEQFFIVCTSYMFAFVRMKVFTT